MMFLLHVVTEPEGERNCTEVEFTCSNRRCIPHAYTCDGDDDCRDFSDEMECFNTPTAIPCNSNQFRCDSDLCIPDFYMCDGQEDCYGDQIAADEIDCEGVEPDCGQGFFNCSNGKCINIHSYCDDADDCGDESDEQDCPGPQCGYNQFQCEYRGALTCITDDWLCDDIVDCDDSSDEFGCSEGCPDTHFQCTTSGDCVRLDQKCDGTPDCGDSSDEYVCPFPPPRVSCHSNQFTCLDGEQCLEMSQVCDSIAHCTDQSDEGAFCDTATDCLVDNGGCQESCHQIADTGSSFCSCPSGYQLDPSDLTSCNDINECDHPDSCTQLCNNTAGGYQCSCVEGYRYTGNSTAGECKAIGGVDPVILFANRVDIRTVSLDSTRRETLVNHLQYAVAIDYHYQLGYMFWTDLYSDDIRRANLDGSNITTIISVGLSAPDGLAVDWVSDKLYWADAENSRIEVSDLDGKKRRLLFSTGLDKPRAMVVDPMSRYLFWTDWGDEPKIERSSMDGKDRRTLHSQHLTWPNSLTIDYPTSTLYWADAKLHIIESSDIHGRNRRPILTTGVLHPFGMTVFENRLYWSDWNTLSILSIIKDVERNMTMIENGVSAQEMQLSQNVTDVQTNLFFPTDLHVVHPVLQPVSVDPCGLDNGGCEYMCLLSSEEERGYSCVCPTGIELMANGKDCNSFDTFLIFARRQELRVISLDVPEINDVALPLSNLTGAVAVDTNPDTESIFWTDKFQNTISTAKIDGSNQTLLIHTDLDNPEGLAVDWVSRKLYWTDDGTSTDTIEVSELDGSNRLVLIHEDLDKPSDIVVHPTAGYLFWSDWGTPARIERANLDGSERVAIVTKHLGRPHGLALDYELDRLYWCDANLDLIESVNLDGNARSIIVKDLSHPFGLGLFGDLLYWTDWQRESLQSVNRSSGEGRTTIVDELGFVLDVNVFVRNKTKPATHPCYVNNGGCSHLCLTRPGNTSGELEVTCACPTGLKVMTDGKTCFTSVQEYVAFPTESLLHQISLDTSLLMDVSTPFSPFREGASIAVDIVTDDLYWTDLVESIIYRAPIAGGQPEAVVTLDLVTPETIVVDWIGRTMYWGDSGTGHIEVSDLDGDNRRVLVKDLVQVLALAIDLNSRTLYWVDGDGNAVDRVPKIEMSALDGSNRTTIVSEQLGRPRAIAVENPIGGGDEGRIYWTDNFYKRIESASLNGSDRRVEKAFNESDIIAPVGIAVTEEYIYWTDGRADSVNRFKKTDNLVAEEVIGGFPNVGHVIVVRKEELVKEALYAHPCTVEHNCSHLCLPDRSPEGYTCSCPTGLSLGSSKTCKNIPSKFAIISSLTKVQRVLLDTGAGENIATTIVGDFERPIAMDHLLLSHDDGLIYFSDTQRHVISSMYMNGTGVTDIAEIGESSGLAVDWVGKLLYWTDTGRNTVEVCRLDGTGRKILVNSGLDEPRGITLDPKNGLMYWTDWGSIPAVFRARMDGSYVSRIIQTDIKWPNGIAIDTNSGRLYWVDAWHNRLESSNINGLLRETVLANENQNLFHSFGVAIQGGYIYWTDWIKRGVIRMGLSPGPSADEGSVVLATTDDRPFGLTVVDTESPRPGELNSRNSAGACNERNGGCSSIHLCLPVDPNYRKCACPDSLLSQCREYNGLKFQPPPPNNVQPPSAAPSAAPPSPAQTTPSTNPTSAPTTTEALSEGTMAIIFTTSSRALEQNRSVLVGDELSIIIALVVVVVVVTVAITLIFLFTYLWIKRFQRKDKLKRNRDKALHMLKLSDTNVNYVGLNTREQQRESSTSTSSSKGEAASLLPKMNNSSTAQQQPRPPRQTNSNIYMEESDEEFIIPGQRKHKPSRPETPDSPLLKKGSPESPPLKPPAPLPFTEPAALKAPRSPPSKPPAPLPSAKPAVLKAPPPVPPKTYAKLKLSVDEPVEVIVQTEVVVRTEPKQSNIERARAVKFHPDAKVPIEDDPPPIPVRGFTPVVTPTVTVAKDPVTIAIETGTVAMASKTDGSGTDDTESETVSDVVVIVDATGTQVGELIPSPVTETPPIIEMATPTSPCRPSPVQDSTEK